LVLLIEIESGPVNPLILLHGIQVFENEFAGMLRKLSL